MSITTTTITEKSKPEIHVQQETIPTGANEQIRGAGQEITVSGWQTAVDLTWPFPVNLLSTEIETTSAHNEDIIELVLDPDGVIGDIFDDVSGSATFIPVSGVALAALEIGKFIKLDDSVNEDDLGRVLTVTASGVTVETATVNSFLASTPTNIKMTTKIMYDLELGTDQHLIHGTAKIDSTHIAANTTLRMRYYNKDGASKRFKFLVEYLY